MPAKLDLVGQRFGRLLVVAPVPGHGRYTRQRCLCDCGRHADIRTSDLRTKNTRSCGACYDWRLRHGHARRNRATDEYRAWANARSRATNTRHRDSDKYSARGVTMCERWRTSFEAFVLDMGPRPSPLHSIDRRDNDSGYWCGTCDECRAHDWPRNARWALPVEQCRNFRRNRLLTHNGVTRCMAEWAETLGMSPTGFLRRLQRGMSPSEAITAPYLPRRHTKYWQSLKSRRPLPTTHQTTSNALMVSLARLVERAFRRR